MVKESELTTNITFLDRLASKTDKRFKTYDKKRLVHKFAGNLHKLLKEEPHHIENFKFPFFTEYKINLAEVEHNLKKYMKYKNIVVIGNGGSINTSLSIYEALKDHVDLEKKLYFISTMEPDYLEAIKKKCPKKDTLILPISKSGNTVGAIESLLSFIEEEYNVLCVTGKKGALRDIAKTLKIDIIDHPDIGGRFSGFSECGIIPMTLVGLDCEKVMKGAKNIFKKYEINLGTITEIQLQKNKLLEIVGKLFYLEEKGYTEVFMPIYSSMLSEASPITIQLMHETFCKDGKGQTFFTAFAPEAQHHTNQRVFGGRDNLICWYTHFQSKLPERIQVPSSLRKVNIKGVKLRKSLATTYKNALNFEYESNLKTAIKNKIPTIAFNYKKIDEESIAEQIALMQLFSIYAAVFRNVNPFDQPAVEESKNLGLKMRKENRV